MKMTYLFKNGYKVDGSALSYQLTVVVEGTDCRRVYNLSKAVDMEYRQLLDEKFNKEEKGGVWGDGNASI